MNNRRKLVMAMGAAALIAPLPSFAQQTKIWHIGVLAVRSRSTLSKPEPYYDAFAPALRDLGA
jgi:hypothetical protein